MKQSRIMKWFSRLSSATLIALFLVMAAVVFSSKALGEPNLFGYSLNAAQSNYLGAFLEYAETKQGTVLLLVAPGVLLILYGFAAIGHARNAAASKPQIRDSREAMESLR